MKPFKLTVTHQGNVLHEPTFDVLEEMKKHRAAIESMELKFNFPIKTVVTPAWVEKVPASYGSGAYEIYHHEIVQTFYDVQYLEQDFTAQIAAEKAEAERKFLEELAEDNALKVIDWNKVRTINDVKAVLQKIVKAILD